jgi:hypothetical protein
MPNKAAKTLEERELVCLKLACAVEPFCRALDAKNHDAHGNSVLTLRDALVVMLAAFFNPPAQSLRLIEVMSQMDWAKKNLSVDKVCKSTLSDGLARLDPEQLKPIIEQMMSRVPHLAQRDPDLQRVCKKIVAGDGSSFALASDVAWAMLHQRGGKDPRSHGTCRLNLQLYVDSFTPADLSVSGADEGSEAGAFAKRILPDVTYLFDRNFVHFGLINRVLEQRSDLVLRLRKDTCFAPLECRLPCAKDIEAGIISDRVGMLGGTQAGRTGPPPTQPMREVLLNGDDGKPVRLITNLLDLPAWVIAALYRKRWYVELFFRWFKIWAGMKHLLSHSKSGVTFQFYVAVIGCLLMHLRTGHKVNKYAIFLFGQVAQGHATLEQILPMLEKIEGEKELERQRLARKKAQKQLSGAAEKMLAQ